MKLVIILLSFFYMVSFTTASAAITPVHAQYHVWGSCEDQAYQIYSSNSVSDGCSKQIGEFWNTSESQAQRTDNKLGVWATAMMGSYPDWSNTWAFAELTFTFTTDSQWVNISFDGLSGEHSFESWIYFVFEDVTNGYELDRRTWSYEFEAPSGDSILPIQLNYAVTQEHLYSVTIGAQAMAGDGGYGFAYLEATVIPEPVSFILLGLGGLLCRKIRIYSKR